MVVDANEKARREANYARRGGTVRFIAASVLLACVLAPAANCLAEIDWDAAREIRPGVRYVALERSEPRMMKAFFIRVDLHTPGLKFAGTGRDPKWGEQMPDYTNHVCHIRTRRQRTSDFMLEQRRPKSDGGKGRDIVVAVNTAPWVPWKDPCTYEYASPYSPLVTEGKVVSSSGTGGKAVFAVYTNGVVDITRDITKDQTKRIWCSYPGFGIIMRDGESIAKPSDRLAPRTAFGLSKDRRWLFLLAVDGRQPGYSLGANMQDLIAFMKEAGAADAMNMDGGGSTTLVYWDAASGRPVICNSHGKSGYTRPVGANMGIYFE